VFFFMTSNEMSASQWGGSAGASVFALPSSLVLLICCSSHQMAVNIRNAAFVRLAPMNVAS
jgi:hypothetical protein